MLINFTVAMISKFFLLSGMALILFNFGGIYITSNSIGLFIVCLAFGAGLIWRGKTPSTERVIYLSLWLFVALAVWILIQGFPLPSQFGANSLWQSAEQLGIEVRPTISIAPNETLNTLVFLYIPFVTFLTGLLIFRSDESVKVTCRYLAYVLSAVVIFSLIQYALFPKKFMLSDKHFYIGSLTGIFVNRNTAGTFLSLTALIFVIWFCEVAKTSRLGYNLERFANGLPMKLGHQHIELLASAAMFVLAVVSLLLTQSRGAMGSFAVSFLLLIILTAIYPVELSEGGSARRRPPLAVKLIRATIGTGVALVTLVLLGGRTLLRIQIAGIEDGRFCVLPGIWDMANDRWLTGWGFGTFRIAFPPYRDPLCGINGTWVRAHNAYLEAYAGLGIIFWPVLAIGIFTLGSVYWKGIRNRRSMRIYAHVGLCGLVLTLAHSAIDFSIQIPGYAAFFALFCALTITASSGRSGNRVNLPKL